MNLEQLLGDELNAQVQAKIDGYNATQTDASKRVKFVDLSEGGYVGKDKYDSKVNGLTTQINDLQGQISQRDTDMSNLQEQLTTAQTDATKLADAQNTLTALQSQYAQDKSNWEAKIAAQAYEFKIRELTNGIAFSSNAAKNEFVRNAIAKNFQLEGDKVLGFDDYVATCKQADPNAFAKAEEGDDGKPSITLGAQGKNPKRDESGFGFSFTGVRPNKAD